VLNSAIRQFEFVDAKILGIVLNCTTESAGGYGKKYYRKYYKQYEKQNAKDAVRRKSSVASSAAAKLKKHE
jgi:Mrp family chromosome partitioning ATPase